MFLPSVVLPNGKRHLPSSLATLSHIVKGDGKIPCGLPCFDSVVEDLPCNTRTRFNLVWEDSTCPRATKPVYPNY